MKATSDYKNKQFPSVANIVDFMRFSVTFNDCKSLLEGLNKFRNDVNDGNNEYLSKIFVPNGIVRIKNGFASQTPETKRYTKKHDENIFNISWCLTNNLMYWYS